MSSPDILALDFDGVVCDGLIEYFQTAWRAYCELFHPESAEPPEGLAERFYPLRQLSKPAGKCRFCSTAPAPGSAR